MLLPRSLKACRGPVRMSRPGMSSLDVTLPIFCLKYWVTLSASNSNSLMLSPRALSRTFLWSSLSSAVRSSMRTMSENPERMTLWAKGEGVPSKGMVVTPILPDSISPRTTRALLMSMSSSRISL